MMRISKWVSKLNSGRASAGITCAVVPLLAVHVVLWGLSATASAQTSALPELGVEVAQIFYTEKVATVVTVFAGTPAEAAGLRPGDALMYVGDVRVVDQATSAVELTRACGTRTTLTVFRVESGMAMKRLQIPVQFATSPPCLGVNMGGGETPYPALQVARVYPDSVAARAGLHVDDWLTMIGGFRVFGDPSIVRQAVAEHLALADGTPLVAFGFRPSTLGSHEFRLPISEARSTNTMPIDGASPADESSVLRGAIEAVQRTAQASGIEGQLVTGVWDEPTLVALTRVLAELQKDDIWGLGWDGPFDGVYTPKFAEHLRVTLAAVEEVGVDPDVVTLMKPFLDALDLLAAKQIYIVG